MCKYTSGARFALCSVTSGSGTRAEQKRLLEEAQNFIDTAPAPVFSVDNQFNVTDWNATAETLSQYEKGEVLGRPFLALLAPELKEGVRDVAEGPSAGLAVWIPGRASSHDQYADSRLQVCTTATSRVPRTTCAAAMCPARSRTRASRPRGGSAAPRAPGGPGPAPGSTTRCTAPRTWSSGPPPASAWTPRRRTHRRRETAVKCSEERAGYAAVTNLRICV